MATTDSVHNTPLADKLRPPTRPRGTYFTIAGAILAAVAATATLKHFGSVTPLSDLPAGLEAARDVPYDVGPSRKLDIVFHSDQTPRPALVMLHEGGWIDGDKSSYHSAMIAWARRGYVTISVNYRLAGEARFPAQAEDCKSVIRWLRAHADHYGIDPNAIGITGWSAGAHLAMLVALTDPDDGFDNSRHAGFSSRVQAAVCVSGVYDLLPDDEARWRDEDHDPCVMALLGGRPSRHRERAKQASPVRYLTLDDPPLLVLHGRRDARINVQQAHDFAAALARLGRTDSVILHSGGHGTDVFPTSPAERLAIETFLDEQLRSK